MCTVIVIVLSYTYFHRVVPTVLLLVGSWISGVQISENLYW